ncbi:MAG: sulfoacetaldehyde acetyltransferase [Halobacteriovoraceae bacterium]|nr:sulfoacetaldehyde acetyltransferase [Halobacteriovoraceae bacterium]
MSASEAFVETLVAHNVKHIFGIVGSAYMDALDLFEPAGIRFISVCHEQGAAHMADGYARVSGKHGVCVGQNGPGITNFVTAIAAAYWAHSPVVAITPEAGTGSRGHGGFQETDQIPIFSKITKYQADIRRFDRIAELTGRAFDYAMLERGPVQINIPRDQFYGEFDARIPQPVNLERSAGGEESLTKAAQLLAKAKFPVILSGGGVVMSGGVNETKELAELLSAPVVNTYLHNDSFPADHKLWCGPIGYQGSKAAMNIIKQADVILCLGTRLGPFGTLPQYDMSYWPEKAQIIQIDANPRTIGLVREVSVGISGDAKLAAKNITEKLKTMGTLTCKATEEARMKELQAQKTAWENELNEISMKDDTPMAPRRALRELEKAMPKNAMVSTDIGNICSVSNSYLRFNNPNSFFAAMSFGNCGYAFPAAIGAQVAAPDRPAVCYVGDGAWGMSFMETYTCVRENIPVTSVVFNNGQWGAEKRNQIDFYANRFTGTNLKNPSFSEVAKAMGADGIKVEHYDQIGDALQKATSSDKHTVVEIMVNQELGEPFRRDALKLPKRLLSKYQDYTVTK